MGILSNQVTCKLCGDTIFSANHHDFVSCQCGAVSVDGGMSYLKRVGTPYEEQSIKIDDELQDTLVRSIHEMTSAGFSGLGILCGVARALRDAGYGIVEVDAKPTTFDYDQFYPLFAQLVDIISDDNKNWEAKHHEVFYDTLARDLVKYGLLPEIDQIIVKDSTHEQEVLALYRVCNDKLKYYNMYQQAPRTLSKVL